MLRSSESSSSDSIPFHLWTLAVVLAIVVLWTVHRSVHGSSRVDTIVIYTPKMMGCQGPDVDSIHLDIQFRSTQQLVRERRPIPKSQSLPSMHVEGSKKTM